MPMTFDLSRARQMPTIAVLLVPRTDVPDSERCFAVLHPNDNRALGRVQVFKDGSAGYWIDEEEQAKPAATLDMAVKRLHEALVERVLES